VGGGIAGTPLGTPVGGALRCITVEILDAEIDVLIRRGRLAPGSRADLVEVRKALQRGSL
jgi:alpha-D-ribose 1-methylphosphonate 5-triphosphate diphosphatase PhnM